MYPPNRLVELGEMEQATAMLGANIVSVGVIGCGTVGHAITQITAQAGIGVTVVEISEGALAAGRARISRSLARLASAEKLGDQTPEEIEARIHGTLDYGDLADCRLVVEAVYEDLDTKLRLWRALDGVLAAEAVCATNTSSLAVIDQAVATGRPERFVGLHFFNPPQVMLLVEVIRTVSTSPAALELALAYVARLGKEPVPAADRAGFIVNRLLVPYAMDAVRILEAGHGSMPGIDTAMRAGAGYPMGPFALLDFIGLDIVLAICETMFAEYREQRFSAPPTIRRLVAAGFLGRKSGRGFYDYSGGEPAPADLALGGSPPAAAQAAG